MTTEKILNCYNENCPYNSMHEGKGCTAGTTPCEDHINEEQMKEMLDQV
jgi:hypothetical protein